MLGRGRDPLEARARLVLASSADLVLEGMELDARLQDFLERWHANAHALAELHLRCPGSGHLSRELRTALRMHGGVPFWNREPAEPLAPLEPA